MSPSGEISAAFKEWMIIVDALERGDQTLILRKGGIAEGRGGFQVAHERFLLFPTGFHEQRDLVIESAQDRFDALSGLPEKGDPIRISSYAEVAESLRVEDLERAKRLEGQHIWRPEVIEQRYEWGRAEGIYAIAVRVYKLPAPVVFEPKPEYGGCKSWVEMERAIPTVDASPVLSDSEFAERLNAFRAALAD